MPTSMVRFSMRLAVLGAVLLCLAGLTAAQATWTTCPVVTNPFNVAADCPQMANCHALMCTCANGTYVNATQRCSVPSSRTCAPLTACSRQFMACLDNALSATCMANYRIAVIAILSGAPYANSTVQTACRVSTCALFNQSSATGCTSRDDVYNTVCVAPTPSPAPTISQRPSLAPGVAKYIATLRIGGNFTAQLADPVKKAALIVAVKADLERILGYAVNIDDLLDGSLIVKFTVDGAANDPNIATALASATGSATWLTSTQAAYTANGGSGALTVIGITADTPAPVPITPVPTPVVRASATSVGVALATLVATALLLVA